MTCFQNILRRASRCVAGFLCLPLAACAVAQAPQSASMTTPVAAVGAQEQIDQGRRTYVSMCARCHGLNLVSNGLGTDLRQWSPTAKERFYLSVNKGVKAMPAWETILKPGQLDSIWRYIGSVNNWPAE